MQKVLSWIYTAIKPIRNRKLIRLLPPAVSPSADSMRWELAGFSLFGYPWLAEVKQVILLATEKRMAVISRPLFLLSGYCILLFYCRATAVQASVGSFMGAKKHPIVFAISFNSFVPDY